jgi:hypothetical protein
MKCLFERATKLFALRATWNDDIPHDPATHVQIVLPDTPDRRTQRLNDTEDGVRPATDQEIADYDLAEADAEISGRLNKEKLIMLLFLINFDQENRIRVLEGNSTITKATYRQALIDKYKAL